MRQPANDEYQIESSGTTGWVNGSDGSCIGRFGVMGVDIHRSFEDQQNGLGECLLCTHGVTGPGEWDIFVEGMQRLHGVRVDASHRPTRLD